MNRSATVVTSEPTVFRTPRTDLVIDGPGARGEVAGVLHDLAVQRVLVIVGGTLGRSTIFSDMITTLEEAGVAVETFVGPAQHNPLASLLRVIDKAWEVRPEAIISVGGGTTADAAKFAALALAANIRDRSTLLDYRVKFLYPDTEEVREIRGTPPPIIALPTTLSAAEWNGFASCVDEEERRKIIFRSRRLTPRVVIIDPELAVLTPRDLWLTSGVRALDHAVESAYSASAHPIATSLALGAVELLASNLRRSVEDIDQHQAIRSCQLAAGMSIAGIHTVSLGLSHALGHQLGAYGVPHGATSCITLPHVMRYLEPATRDVQERIARALAGGRNMEGTAAELMEKLFTSLDVPRRIREFGIDQEQLDRIAAHALQDLVVRECPVPLTHRTLLDLLTLAW